jgi:putative hemolysin
VTFVEGLSYDTQAGLILDKLGRFPGQGEKVFWKDFILTCEEVIATAIVKARLAALEDRSGQ